MNAMFSIGRTPEKASQYIYRADSEHGYFLAVETAFQQWEALQTAGHVERSSPPGQTS